MALRKLALKTTHDHKGKRLDQVLSEWLPQALSQPVSKGQARKLIVAGAVYLNGKRVRIASKELQAGARVEAFVDLEKLRASGPSKDQVFKMGPARILFEDEYLVVVDKPAGLPTQPTLDEARDNLFAAVKKYLAERDSVAQPYLGLHHRLDRDTSGVVLFTKKPEANAATAALFSQHLAQKTYVALAHAPREKKLQWAVKNYLGKVDKSGKKARFGAVRSGGDFAHTDFKLLEDLGPVWLVQAEPLTGRTHQIRVHLAEEGMPILADTHYGAPASDSSRAPRVMLHALRLTFPHPIHKNQVSIEAALPEDFSRCLKMLRR